MKKLLSIILSSVAALCLCLGLAACADGTEETKYDVAIRVACSDGEIYEFPVGTDEKHVTIPYDGEERTFWVDSYNLPNHPRWSDDWFSPSGEGVNVFSLSILYGNEESWLYEADRVYEQGRYSVAIQADSTSDLWNFRSCRLYISVN